MLNKISMCLIKYCIFEKNKIMRKTLLFVLLFTQISFAIAQSLVVTGDTSFTSNNPLIQFEDHLDVKNISGNSITIKCIKTNLILPAGAESYYCFAGNCYSVTTDTSSSSATLTAGQQISFNNSPPDADAHSGYYDAFGTSGIAEVRYCFYDVNNTADETCVIITYSSFGISYDCVNGVCLDPGTGLGAYLDSNTCQSSCVMPTWDCANGACSDPGTGNGTYPSLNTCMTSCGVTPTWDCDGQGNCSDPGTGNGTYVSLSTCQSNCIVPTWDCDGQGNCSDPGTGQGTYTDSNICQVACVTNINEKKSNIPKISNFYPNPASGMVSFSFNGNLAILELIDILGNKVREILLNQEGIKQLDLSDLNNGMYFGNLIVNDQVVLVKKLMIK